MLSPTPGGTPEPAAEASPARFPYGVAPPDGLSAQSARIGPWLLTSLVPVTRGWRFDPGQPMDGLTVKSRRLGRSNGVHYMQEATSSGRCGEPPDAFSSVFRRGPSGPWRDEPMGSFALVSPLALSYVLQVRPSAGSLEGKTGRVPS